MVRFQGAGIVRNSKAEAEMWGIVGILRLRKLYDNIRENVR